MTIQWFYLSLNGGTSFVAVQARDEDHARERIGTRNVVDAIQPLGISGDQLWLSVQQSFPLKAGK